MKDKSGFLPAHVACSRHCPLEKLRMLLDVNPHALFETTNKGATLLDLARSTATKSHPNLALIKELEGHMKDYEGMGKVLEGFEEFLLHHSTTKLTTMIFL